MKNALFVLIAFGICVKTEKPTDLWGACTRCTVSERALVSLKLRGGISKFYNKSEPSRRGGIFEEPTAGVGHDEGQSVWNKGGWSFEERDYTQFCLSKMDVLISEIRSPFKFFNISAVKGHSLVTYRQGKKRAGVNWDELKLNWTIGPPCSSAEAKGILTIKEFFSEFPDDIELLVQVTQKGDGSFGSVESLRSGVQSMKREFMVILEKLVDEMMSIRSKNS